jgi:hypothetical protein
LKREKWRGYNVGESKCRRQVKGRANVGKRRKGKEKAGVKGSSEFWKEEIRKGESRC